jgi:hypothetical protein
MASSRRVQGDLYVVLSPFYIGLVTFRRSQLQIDQVGAVPEGVAGRQVLVRSARQGRAEQLQPRGKLGIEVVWQADLGPEAMLVSVPTSEGDLEGLLNVCVILRKYKAVVLNLRCIIALYVPQNAKVPKSRS